MKIATPPWKKLSNLSQQPFSKSWGPVKSPSSPPPTILKIWLEIQPHQQKEGGGGVHYAQALEIDCKYEQKKCRMW